MKNVIEILKSQGIELTEEQSKLITKEVLENYKTINDYNVQNGKLKVAEQNFIDTQKAYDDFKKEFDGVDVEELKRKLINYETQLNTQKKDYETRIKKIELDSILNDVAKEMGCTDFDLAKTQINYDDLLKSKNQNEDVKTVFENLKENKPILFKEEDKPTKQGNIIGGLESFEDDDQYKQMRAVMGLENKEGE